MLKQVICAALSVAMTVSFVPAVTAAEENAGMILNYTFDSVSSDKSVVDMSGKGNDGIVYGDASIEPGRIYFDGKDDYIKMPDGLLQDADEVTVAINMCPEFDTLHYFTWNFGTSASEGYMFLNTSRPDAKLRFAITPADAGREEALASDNDIKKGTWSSVIVTIKDKHGVMYRDGEKAAEADFKLAPKDLGATTQNWIARSPYGDALMQGYVEDFRVYNYALTDDEAAALAGEYKENLSDSLTNAFIESGIKSVVKSDLSLPTAVGDSMISWASSNEAVISNTGKVTRPARGDFDAAVVLTATINGIDKKVFSVTVPPEGGGRYSIDINGERGADINPGMVGLFFEDINYAADGGLYAEMVENRSFEALYADNKDFEPKYDGGWAWSIYPDGGELELKSDKPLNENNTHYLSFDASHKSFANAAYDGLALKKDMVYHGSFYARTSNYTGAVKISAVKNGKTYSEVSIEKLTDEWSKYSFDMTAAEDIRGAQLVITLDGTGIVDFDMISLIPDDAVNGVFRKDLADMLKAIKPGFLRFPGGCVIEGYNLDNRYKWKDSIAPIEERIENWNRWDLHTDGYNHYNQTLGLGFYEFFELCEYLECDAVPVVNVGMACQFQTNELVPIDSDEFKQYIQDALDLIEFANGDISTEWGAKRAELGHPEPFGMTMLGIGNEQWNTEKNQFWKRYEAFESAIHAKYPEIKLIGTTGPDVGSGGYRRAWEWIRSNAERNDNFVYAVDEHYYMTPDWFLQNNDFYDDYDRGVKVFAGEYASRTRNKPNDPEANTLYTALTEAAYFTGLERNSDVVEMTCYAPLFARVGYTQWSPDLIWFDDASVYGSPSYYAQKMNSNNLGDYNVRFDIADGSNTNGIFTNVSYDKTRGELIVKLVNTTEDERLLDINNDFMFAGTEATVTYITGDSADISNSIENPTKVTEQAEKVDTGINGSMIYTLKPYTFAVIRIPAFTPEAVEDIYNGTRGGLLGCFVRMSMDDFDITAKYDSTFTDIPENAWYRNSIGFLQQKGIVEGYDDYSFKPEQEITKAEIGIVVERLINAGYDASYDVGNDVVLID